MGWERRFLKAIEVINSGPEIYGSFQDSRKIIKRFENNSDGIVQHKWAEKEQSINKDNPLVEPREQWGSGDHYAVKAVGR